MDLLQFLPAGRRSGRVQKNVRRPALAAAADWL
jgi:hypothetical protein